MSDSISEISGEDKVTQTEPDYDSEILILLRSPVKDDHARVVAAAPDSSRISKDASDVANVRFYFGMSFENVTAPFCGQLNLADGSGRKSKHHDIILARHTSIGQLDASKPIRMNFSALHQSLSI